MTLPDDVSGWARPIDVAAGPSHLLGLRELIVDNPRRRRSRGPIGFEQELRRRSRKRVSSTMRRSIAVAPADHVACLPGHRDEPTREDGRRQ